jgi:predicted nucleic acid-binding protein
LLILDTNVVSELINPLCSPVVLEALSRFPTEALATTVISEAELRSGAGRLPEGRRRRDLIKAIDQILGSGLGGRILPFDRAAAAAYAVISETRTRIGRPIAVLDAMIAAVCEATGATLATRNVRDFQGCGIELIDPWSES